jgi:hypothetical protein
MNVMFPWMVALIGAVLAFLGFLLWLRQRQQHEALRTLRQLIDRGIVPTPELVREMGIRRAASDLRRGAMSLCIAAGIAAFGALNGLKDGDYSSLLTFIAIAVFPALIGAVRILFHWTDHRRR